MGGEWSMPRHATPRPVHLREREPVPIVQEPGLAPGPFLTGVKNGKFITAIGDQAANNTVCSKSTRTALSRALLYDITTPELC
jgi:hypothetical protein